ncbi:hypothetical protein Pdw03_8943 [Penicillium digitatum]|uniref:Lipoprotein n=1 Tax=Penicillium digitatum TaxID=36651 RepID=A0A7T6XPS9_PENDI|nr:hypothetical protein Pdw03_8943 [Penicillium digitatum]
MKVVVSFLASIIVSILMAGCAIDTTAAGYFQFKR